MVTRGFERAYWSELITNANAKPSVVRKPLAIVVQMPASHPMLPNNDREIATRQASRQGRVSDEWTLVEFRPARWLLTVLTVLTLWLVGPQLGKRGLLALAWKFAPRRLRLVAGGVAAFALVVLAGSVAALALVLTQLA